MESKELKVVDSSEVYEPPMLLDLDEVEQACGSNCSTGGAATN